MNLRSRFDDQCSNYTTPFARKNIVGAARSGGVHDLETSLGINQRSQQVQWRKALTTSGANQRNDRLVLTQGGKCLCGQRIKLAHFPRRFKQLWPNNKASFVALAVDSQETWSACGNQVQTSHLIEVKFHCLLHRDCGSSEPWIRL